MRILFVTFIICLLQITNLFARDWDSYRVDCPRYNQTPADPKLLLAAEQANCVATSQAYKCEDLRNDLEDSDKHKVIKCDAKSLKDNSIENTDIKGCIWNGIKLSVESIADLAGSIVKHMNCADDVPKKREMITAFNIAVADKRFQVEESRLGRWLEEAGCTEVEKLLSSRYQYYQDTMMRERIIAINTGKKPRDLPVEQKKETPKGPSILEMLKEAMKKAEVSYQCYTPKVKAEMFCVGVTTLIVDAAAGGGVAMAVKKIAQLVKSKKALERIERAVEAGEKADLKDAAKLVNKDRLKAAQALLKRELSEAEKKAIVEAHEVGMKEGRGFYTYTQEDILKKARILREAGIEDAKELRALMENGITGTFGRDPFFRKAITDHFQKLVAATFTAAQADALIAIHELGRSSVSGFLENATKKLREAGFKEDQIRKILESKAKQEGITTSNVAKAVEQPAAPARPTAQAPVRPESPRVPAATEPTPPQAAPASQSAAPVADSPGRKAVLNNFKDDKFVHYKSLDVPENLTGEALEAKLRARRTEAKKLYDDLVKKAPKNTDVINESMSSSIEGVNKAKKSIAEMEEKLSKLPERGADMRRKEYLDQLERSRTSLEMYQKRCKGAVDLYRDALNIAQFLNHYEREYERYCK